MIEFRYNRKKVSAKQAVRVGAGLEESLRNPLQQIRPGVARTCGVTVEGDPFRIARNQPDLRIYVFYHEEWHFTNEELWKLAQGMGENVKSLTPTDIRNTIIPGHRQQRRIRMRCLFQSVVAGILFLIPFWLWLGMYLLISPDTAIARLLVVGFGLYFFGAIQLICLVVYVFLVLPAIWIEAPARRSGKEWR